MNGATGLEPGAIRPEIIVPFFEYTGELAEPTSFMMLTCAKGMPVRIVK